MAQLLRKHKLIGWRRHLPLIGTPDFVFPKQKLVVFVDGCFWHGCPKHSNHAKKSGLYWQRKLEANRARDRRVTRALHLAGWRVLRVWEHELARKNRERLVRRIQRALDQD